MGVWEICLNKVEWAGSFKIRSKVTPGSDLRSEAQQDRAPWSCRQWHMSLERTSEKWAGSRLNFSKESSESRRGKGEKETGRYTNRPSAQCPVFPDCTGTYRYICTYSARYRRMRTSRTRFLLLLLLLLPMWWWWKEPAAAHMRHASETATASSCGPAVACRVPR